MAGKGETFESVLADLLLGIHTASDDEAIVAMLLELNSFPIFPANNENFYEDFLPSALLERPLEPDEEVTIVDELHELVLRSLHAETHLPKTPGLIAALGNANPWVSAPRILDLVVRHTDEMTLDEFHQAVHALDKSLSRIGADHSRYPELLEAIRRTDPTSTLSRVAASDPKTDPLTECLPRDIPGVLGLVRSHLGESASGSSHPEV